jgi:membrane protease YdiL (CAAX protease family)
MISQGIFALFHIPNQIYKGASSADMIFTLSKIFLLGIIISLIYLRTKNLFIAMGIHALWNLPNLFVSDNIGGYIAFILALVLLVVWPLSSKANPVKISKQANIIV